MNLNKFQKILTGLFFIIFLFSIFYFLFSDRVLAANAEINCSNQEKSSKYPWCTDEPQNIADLVGKFYKYALAAVGVAALGAIIYGGILHTVSAGNPSNQSEARAWIWGAVSGVTLLLGAYLLLNTINPELVKLTNPKIDEIDKKKIEIATSTQKNKSEKSGFNQNVNTRTQELSGEPYDTEKECSAHGSTQYGNRLIGADLSGDAKRCIIRYCKIDTAYVKGKGCISTKY